MNVLRWSSLVVSMLLLGGCAATHDAFQSPDLQRVEIALAPLARKIEAERPGRRQLEHWMKAYLREYPSVYGTAYAPVPSEGSALYVYRGRGGFRTQRLSPPSYDFTQMEWYRKPIAKGAPHWSEPYYDAGGGEIWMRTYSIPLRAANGRIFAVLTSDLPERR